MKLNFKEALKKNRPNLSDQSVKTYSSVLNGLLKKLNTSDTDVFLDYDKIYNVLKDKKYSSRKTDVSAIIVLIEKKASDDILKKYKNLLDDDVKRFKDNMENQEKSETQKKNWISYEEIKKMYDEMTKQANPLFKKSHFSDSEKQYLQNYIIFSSYFLIPPRRLLDFSELKYKNYNDEDNYIKNNKFYFNKYKTSKSYGLQILDIPRQLMNIYKKWFKIIDPECDYLLCDRNNNKLTSPTLNQRLNKIFNKKISVNMLRHIYISENVLKDVPKLEELKKVASEMGHSVEEQTLYKKV